jgi:hypothetical protein
MNRRTLLRYVGLAGIAEAGKSLLAQKSSSSKENGATHPIVLYCDMAVDPAQEQKMIDYFHNEFKPAAQSFQGYIDVKIVKVRRVMQGGPLTQGVNYRFQLTYESEALRQKWISSQVHRMVWPHIEDTLINKRDYLVLLTDSI